MDFGNYKKIFTIIGLMAVILPSLFLIAPKKAEALVPVIDVAAIAVTTAGFVATNANIYMTNWNLSNMVSKEIGPIGLPPVPPIGIASSILSWDSIAYMLGKVLLSALTESVVNWIRSGFQGNPLFITDPAAFFADAADQATGRFFKEFLSPGVYNFICSPFRIDLLIGLKFTNNYAERMRCTLSTVFTNVQNGVQFGAALRNGDWGDWMSATLNMQNNPGGALLTSLDELDARRSNARNIANTESIFNAGFLGMKKCVEYYADEWTGPGPGGQGTCIRYETTSPGKWVSDELSSATGIEFQRLGLANSLNEILSALIFQLFSTLTQGIRR